MAFEHRITARFHEVDAAGVVFFGRYFEYAHQAFEALLDRALPAGESPFERVGFGLPLVHVEGDFARPTRRGDALVIRTVIERWTERSVTFRHTVVGEGDPADVRAVVRLKHAYVRFPEFKPVPRPAAFVQAMEALGVVPADEAP